MKTKLNNFIKLTLLLLVGFLLAGCMPTPDPTPVEPSSPTGPINLQWWGVFWPQEVVQPLIDEYQNANSGVTISYANKWPGGNRNNAARIYQDEVDRVLRDNNPVSIPDIFMVENTWAGNYEPHVAPAPSAVIDVASVQSAFYPPAAKDFTFGGTVYGLPLWMDSLAIVYNRAHLAEKNVTTPPTEWVAFKNLAQSLTTGTGANMVRAGFAAGTANNVSFGAELLSLLLLQNGVAIQDATSNMPIFSTDADTEIALNFYKSFATGNSATWNTNLSNDAVAFLEGKLSMLAAPSWRYNDLKRFNTMYNLGLDIGIAPMPQLSGQSRTNIHWANYWGLMAARNRPNSAQAWHFINWLTQPEQLEKLRASEKSVTDNLGFMYPRTNMQQLLIADPDLRIYNSSLPDSDTWYMVDGLAVRGIINELISSNGTATQIASAENRIRDIVSKKGQL